MQINIRCPECSSKLRLPEAHAGKAFRCPKCKSVIRDVLPENSPDATSARQTQKTADQRQHAPSKVADPVTSAEGGIQVFLSHNTADKPLIEQIGLKLREEQINPWLDKWNLVPGEPFQDAIEDALDCCGVCVVFVGSAGIGPWQNEEMRLAISRQVSEGKSFRVIPVLLPGAARPKRSQLPSFLKDNTWVEFRATVDEEIALHRLVCGIRGVPPGSDPADKSPFDANLCPYRGLESFNAEHARFFFGRKALTEWLLSDLEPQDGSPEENRFLAIVGASGSGKSSLARAGLLPALRDNQLKGSDKWPIVVVRPGSEPIESLAVALTASKDLNGCQGSATELMRRFTTDGRTLHLTTRVALHDRPDSDRVVVLVDQFEELFTICESPEKRRAAIDNLLYAATISAGKTIVVITMRADFYGKCASYPDLAAALSDHQILVGPMNDAELRQAIEQPALLCNRRFDDGLIDLLIEHTKDESGGLPLLQYALAQLWDRQENGRLTVASYNDLGKLAGALKNRANDVFDKLSAGEKDACRRLFLRLTNPGEGTEDTKRRVSYAELGESDVMEKVIRKLTDARLITTEGAAEDGLQGRGSVEVSHEALIRGWPELRKWVDSNRESLRIHHRLIAAAAEWNGKEDESKNDFLYRGALLAQAEEWAQNDPDQLSPLEREFLEASIAERDRQRQQEARRAERMKRRAILAAIASVAATILAVVAGIFFVDAQSANNDLQLEQQETQANLERALAAEKRADDETRRLRDERSRQDVVKAWQAYDAGDPAEALLWLSHAVELSTALTNDEKVEGGAHDDPIAALDGASQNNAIVKSEPESRRFAMGDDLQWRLNQMRFFSLYNSSAVEQFWPDARFATFSPDGKLVVTTENSGDVSLWETESGRLMADFHAHDGPVLHASFSEDSQRLVTSAADKRISVHDIATAAFVWSFEFDEVVSRSWLRPDGTVVSLCSDGTVRVLDHPNQRTNRSPGNLGRVLAFNDQRTRFVAASNSHDARVFSVGSWEQIGGTVRHEYAITSAMFSPNGGLVATTSGDSNPQSIVESAPYELSGISSDDGGEIAANPIDNGQVRIWNSETGEIVAGPIELRSGATYVTFSPDSQTVAVVSGYESVHFLDVRTGDEMRAPITVPDLRLVNFSPDGSLLATTGSGLKGPKTRIWNLESRLALVEVEHSSRWHTSNRRPAVFSRDGSRAVISSANLQAPSCSLVNIEIARSTSRILDKSSGVDLVYFNESGDRVISWNSDNIFAWNVHDRELFIENSSERIDLRSRSSKWVPEQRVRTREYVSDDGELRALEEVYTVNVPIVEELLLATPSEFLDIVRYEQRANATAELLQQIDLDGNVEIVGSSYDAQFVVTNSVESDLFGRNRGKGAEARVWDAKTSSPVTPPLPHGAPITSARFSRDNRLVVTVSNRYEYFDPDDPAVVPAAPEAAAVPEAIAEVEATADGAVPGVPGESADGSDLLIESDEEIPDVPEDFPDLPFESSVGSEGLLDVPSDVPVESSVNGVEQIGDDQNPPNPTVRVWDRESGQPVTPPLVHDRNIRQVIFSPDNRYLATLTNGGIRLWTLQPNRQFSAEVAPMLARAIAGQKIDSAGKAITMDMTEWQGEWLFSRFNSTRQDLSGEELIRWHEAGMRIGHRKRFPRVMQQHAEQVIRLKPNDWNAHAYLGEALASVGEFKHAESAFQTAIDQDADNAEVWTSLARLKLLDGDRDGWLELCDEAMKRFRASASLNELDELVWLQLLAPSSTADYAKLLKIAETLNSGDEQGGKPFPQTLLAALVRAQNLERAAEHQYGYDVKHYDLGRILLYIAQFQTGNENAKWELGSLRNYIKEDKWFQVESNWRHQVDATILFREAEQAVGELDDFVPEEAPPAPAADALDDWDDIVPVPADEAEARNDGTRGKVNYAYLHPVSSRFTVARSI